MRTLLTRAALVVILALPAVAARALGPGDITTVAGIGGAGSAGDGGPATSASLNSPARVAFDGNGNLFIADTFNGRIRRVDTQGIISTVVSGLAAPFDVAIDAGGNLYIADFVAARILRFDSATSTLTTVAGTGNNGYNGDGIAATSATLTSPAAVALDSAGNVYIADFGNHRIRKVDAVTGTIMTVAGTGTAGYNGDGVAANSAQLANPASVSFDEVGNLYIADFSNQRVRKVSAADGNIATVAGSGTLGYAGDGGPATSAELNAPAFVAIDGGGNLFVADFGNSRVRKVDSAGTITTYAGNGVATFAGDGGPASAASLKQAQGVALDAAGNLYIADRFNNRVRKVVAAAGYTPAQPGPVEVAFDLQAPGGETVTADLTFQSVSASGTTSVVVSEIGPVVPAGFKLGDPPLYYDVSTTAAFSGTVMLCFGWPDGQFFDPAQVRLMHYHDGIWEDVTTSVNVNTRVICGATATLSPFALVETAYSFTGFLNPVANLPALNNVHPGSVVPMKFSLGRFYGLDIFAAGFPRAQTVSCDGPDTGEISSADTAGASGLTYDASADQYVYTWKTDKTWTGCKRLEMLFKDGGQQAAGFRFTK